MSWSLADLRLLRKPLMAAGVCLLVGAATAWAGWTLRQQAQARFDRASMKVSEAEARAAAAVADRANIDAYQAVILQMRARGVIGPEQRLPWIEYFTALNAAGNPAELTLKIEPRRTLEDAPVTPEPLENLQFYASKLTLTAKLLHEVDLLRMLARLKTVKGAAIIRQCSLLRADGSNAVRPYLLESACEGEIITLDKPPVAPPPP
ncbi:hypothetical protein [Chitinimonas sp. BJYL2]|uniref:hypothetical protein n=1 Tax=Chitinimonas sp. BJYL2 TaxID=2976696 RepID=UPI0022B5794F|nr:hypothetical protein [Chitinimonas sp. BJYL2]